MYLCDMYPFPEFDFDSLLSFKSFRRMNFFDFEFRSSRYNKLCVFLDCCLHEWKYSFSVSFPSSISIFCGFLILDLILVMYGLSLKITPPLVNELFSEHNRRFILFVHYVKLIFLFMIDKRWIFN